LRLRVSSEYSSASAVASATGTVSSRQWRSARRPHPPDRGRRLREPARSAPSRRTRRTRHRLQRHEHRPRRARPRARPAR
jgi:hypothetical protein